MLASYARMMLPSVWSSLFRVNKQAFGTFVSLVMLIFFSPSNKRNDSKAGGAFIFPTGAEATLQTTGNCFSQQDDDFRFLLFNIPYHTNSGGMFHSITYQEQRLL